MYALRACRARPGRVVTKKAPPTPTPTGRRAASPRCSPDDSFEPHVEDTLEAGDGLCDTRTSCAVRRARARRSRRAARATGVDWRAASDGPASSTWAARAGTPAPRRAPRGRHRPRDPARALAAGATTRTSRCSTTTSRSTSVDGAVRRRAGALRRLRARPRQRRGQDDPRARPCSPPAAPARSTSTPPTPTSRPATASRWRTAPAPRSRTWSSSSSTRPCLYHPHAKTFLISEALRGEGGVLRLANGERFMERYHEREGPGPARRRGARDRQRAQADRRRLRVPRHDPPRPAVRAQRFPNIHERCLRSASTSPTSRSRWCRRRTTCAAACATDQDGAHQRAEPVRDRRGAFTGLHGANRLASNSLLEGMVFAARAARRAARARGRRVRPRRCRRGSRATPPTRTRRSSSPSTGTRSAASCGPTSASQGRQGAGGQAPGPPGRRQQHRVVVDHQVLLELEAPAQPGGA